MLKDEEPSGSEVEEDVGDIGDEAADEDEQRLEIHIKRLGKNETKVLSFSMEPSCSVLDLKTRILNALVERTAQEVEDADSAVVPIERQRLIFAGRMLRDDNACLSGVDIKMMPGGVPNFVHLTPLPKGALPSQRPKSLLAVAPAALAHHHHDMQAVDSDEEDDEDDIDEDHDDDDDEVDIHSDEDDDDDGLLPPLAPLSEPTTSGTRDQLLARRRRRQRRRLHHLQQHTMGYHPYALAIPSRFVPDPVAAALVAPPLAGPPQPLLGLQVAAAPPVVDNNPLLHAYRVATALQERQNLARAQMLAFAEQQLRQAHLARLLDLTARSSNVGFAGVHQDPAGSAAFFHHHYAAANPVAASLLVQQHQQQHQHQAQMAMEATYAAEQQRHAALTHLLGMPAQSIGDTMAQPSLAAGAIPDAARSGGAASNQNPAGHTSASPFI